MMGEGEATLLGFLFIERSMVIVEVRDAIMRAIMFRWWGIAGIADLFGWEEGRLHQE